MTWSNLLFNECESYFVAVDGLFAGEAFIGGGLGGGNAFGKHVGGEFARL